MAGVSGGLRVYVRPNTPQPVILEWWLAGRLVVRTRCRKAALHAPVRIVTGPAFAGVNSSTITSWVEASGFTVEE